jgi:hypothetical protein
MSGGLDKKHDRPFWPNPEDKSDIILNLEYSDGVGITIGELIAKSDARLLAEHGPEWMDQNRDRLDHEMKEAAVRGLLT